MTYSEAVVSPWIGGIHLPAASSPAWCLKPNKRKMNMSIVIFAKKNSIVALSFEDLLKKSEALTKVSPPALYSELLHDLVKSGLDGIQTERVLESMRKSLGCHHLKTVRDQYKAIKNKLLNAQDIGLLVAKETLKEFYADGLFLKRNNDGCYYLFDKTHWRVTSLNALRNNIQKTASQHLTKTNKGLAALTSDALRCLDDLLASDADLLGMTDIPPPVINCRNYELWFGEDGSVETRPHHPASLLFACLDYDYDPDATCPVFDKAIREIFSKSSTPEDMVRHFEELMGHVISMQRHIAMFVLMIGQGNDGKSKLLETIQKLVGMHAVLSDSMATFQKDRFNMAALHGKLLFCDDDVKIGITLNDEMIKKLSECKLLSARHPYGKKKFSFRNLALPMLSSNGFPKTDDISPGMLRRAHLIPFDRQFQPDEDNKVLFTYIFENEMPGILNRALQGLQRLKQRGGFKEPEDCLRAKREFFAHANPLYAFINDRTRPSESPDYEITIKEFRERFILWAKEQGLPVSVQTKTFVRVLRGLENEFGFKVTEAKAMKKTAYPKIYGREFLQDDAAEE